MNGCFLTVLGQKKTLTKTGTGLFGRFSGTKINLAFVKYLEPPSPPNFNLPGALNRMKTVNIVTYLYKAISYKVLIL